MHPISDNRVVGRHEPVRSEQYDLRLAEMATPEGIMRQLAGTAVTWEQAQAIQNIVRNGIRQIGNRLAPPAVLELKVLQAFHLLGLQPTKLLAPDNTSPRSRRSGGFRPPCSGPARPEPSRH